MNGKSKCKILKDIRRKIAADNDIQYVTSECKYQGDCAGTCPKCEAELQYLENELRKRQAAGKAIAVAGIAAAVMLGSTACASSSVTTKGDVPYQESSSSTNPSSDLPEIGEVTDPTEDIELEGDVVVDGEVPDEDELAGAPPLPPDEELAGEPSQEDPDSSGDSFFEGEPGLDDGDWGSLH